jgi:hypothetical protein
MDIGGAFGFIGSIAGIGAVLWIHLRDRKEREGARETAREEELAAEKRREKAEQERRQSEEERRARDVRRARHQDDYRATVSALERLKEIAYNIEIGELRGPRLVTMPCGASYAAGRMV